MSILSISALIMIANAAQHQTAFAGACFDEDNDGYYAPDSPSYCGDLLDCNDDDPNVYPGHGCALPAEEINNLIAEINDLADNGGIPSSQESSLIAKLQTAVQKIEANNEKGAIGSLEAFINQVKALFKAGKISSSVRDQLIGPVQSVIDTLKAT